MISTFLLGPAMTCGRSQVRRIVITMDCYPQDSSRASSAGSQNFGVKAKPHALLVTMRLRRDSLARSIEREKPLCSGSQCERKSLRPILRNIWLRKDVGSSPPAFIHLSKSKVESSLVNTGISGVRIWFWSRSVRGAARCCSVFGTSHAVIPSAIH